MQVEPGAKAELALAGRKLVVQRVEADPDPKEFFAGVKFSRKARDLIKVGRARGKEIR